MEKKPKCKCRKMDLPQSGPVVIRCAEHRGKPSKSGRLLCYMDDNGIVRREGDPPTPKGAPEPPPSPLEEFVYFARIGDSIKIGHSGNPEQRADSLGAELMGFVPGDREFEAQLHHRLRKYRLRREWYRDAPKLQKVIRKVLAAE